jgi:hypothetical protein
MELFVRLEKLSNAIKTANGLRESKYRYDAISYIGNIEILRELFNEKGMLYFNLIPNNGNIKPNPPFFANYFLNDRFANNFTSLYYLHTNTPCFGYANKEPQIKGKPNPMYKYKDDLFLFDLSNENVIDLYILKNQKQNAMKCLESFEECKAKIANETLKPIYNYKM